MRQPTYLSPSSIKTFLKSREEYYLQYLADERPPKFPQTKPMAVGAAFDAYIKHHLVKMLQGNVPEQFEFDNIFETQVEEQNREWAKEHGFYLFKCYKDSGALARLMTELEQASSMPKFEFTVEQRVAHETCITGVPLLGKPDVFFMNKVGKPVILDWKVNGYCSKNRTVARKGYIWYLGQPSYNHNQAHKDACPMMVDGLIINVATPLEDVNQDWAEQLSIYLWVLGQPIGVDATVGIDQLCGQGATEDSYTPIGIAQHRCKISKDFQKKWFAQIVLVWKMIESGNLFPELTEEERRIKEQQLNDYYKAFKGDSQNQEWYNKMMGRK